MIEAYHKKLTYLNYILEIAADANMLPASIF